MTLLLRLPDLGGLLFIAQGAGLVGALYGLVTVVGLLFVAWALLGGSR